MKSRKKRVVVAMSGGVDSSVAALLLKKEGYEVVGMSMQVYDSSNATERWGSCCSIDDLHDARKVANQLDIPFYVVNFEERFKKEVIDEFVKQYSKGKTPNPCVICNTKLKFNHLMQRADAVDAEYVATGHYARIDSGGGKLKLLCGIDDEKDQSYFLFDLNQQQLKRILFPLGNLKKSQVREIANREGLLTSSKEESQEICFVEDSYGDFIEKSYPQNVPVKGNFVDLKGNILGKHRGIHRYTVGQRKGLALSFGAPRYVVRIDACKNEVVVGEDKDLFENKFKVKNINWIADEPNEKQTIKTKIRYKSDAKESTVKMLSETEAMVEFDTPQRAITPGQAAVFYHGNEVLGGGWIDTL